MKNLLTKVLFSALAGLIILFSFAPYFSPAKAQTWYNQSFQEWYGKVYDPTNPSEIFGERYTAAQVQWIIYGLGSFLLNTMFGSQNAGLIQCFISNGANISTCADQLTTLLTFTNLQNKTLTSTNTPGKQNLSSLVFASNRSISGISYFNEKVQQFKPIPVVHAQTPGFGFTTALKPVQDLWKAFRNIAFGLFVVVAIVFAFMIMFRVKLSPQTVVSVQSALPKIIISIVLVTFSYAIAGFLVDLMYVVIGLLSTMIAPLVPTVTLLQPNKYQAGDVFNLLTTGRTLDVLSTTGILNLIATYLMPLLLIFVIIFAIGLLFAETGFGVIVAVISFIALIAIIIVGLWNSIKVIWTLFKAFTNIILLTIFAPIQLALGILIPNFGFGAWVKNYLAALSVFVVTGLLWLFAWIFSIYAWQSLIPGKSLVLPVASTDAWPPLLGSSNFGVTMLFAGVSFVLFTLIPKATELVQSFISGKPFAYGTAIGEAFGAVNWAYGASGAKGNVEMATKAYRQSQLERAFAHYDDPTRAPLSARTIARLENLPVVGGVVTNVRNRVQEGLTRGNH